MFFTLGPTEIALIALAWLLIGGVVAVVYFASNRK
jgi:hypothetical protein